ncbi:MAG: hypothetical protein FJX62_04555 [Alphaproteobacteria bacterium]|nr:hypothetical protein [Alphaproteobacteria bacterium]
MFFDVKSLIGLFQINNLWWTIFQAASGFAGDDPRSLCLFPSNANLRCCCGATCAGVAVEHYSFNAMKIRRRDFAG